VSDSDGGKAGKGSFVTLTFTTSVTAIFNAVKPGENFIDSGAFRVAGGKIIISLPQLGISVTNQSYTLSGTTLVLPFKVSSEGTGTSTWSAPNPGSGDKEQGPGPGPGTGPGPGPGAGPGTDSGTGPSSASGPGPSPLPLPDQESLTKLAGVWQGWGAGYEIRFRRKNMMTLAVKHATLLTIGVNDQGVINGGGGA
jgi:hypothetical protein